MQQEVISRPAQEAKAGIDIPEKYRYLLEEDPPSIEYREAIVRDFVKANPGKILKYEDFQAELGYQYRGQVSNIIPRLKRRGNLIATLHESKSGRRVYSYEWVDNPSPSPSPSPSPFNFRGRTADGAVKQKSLYTSLLQRLTITLRDQLKDGPRTVKTKDWVSIMGTNGFTWNKLSRALVASGVLIKSPSDKERRLGSNTPAQLTWNEAAFQRIAKHFSIPVPKVVVQPPQIINEGEAAAPQLTETPVRTDTHKSEFEKGKLFRAFIAWMDQDLDRPADQLKGAALFRMFLENWHDDN